MTLYTIGYSGFSLPDFLALLKQRDISLVVDVRSQPHSRYYSDYDKQALSCTLKGEGLYYRNYDREFGARQTDPRYASPGGYLDFERFAQSPQFLEGLDKLERSMAQGYRFALMCAEKDPVRCHRAILVARAFFQAGYEVVHLMPEGRSCTQAELESRLVDQYFPDRDQISLFGAALSEEDYVAESYRRQNAAIGYTMQEADE